MPTYIALINWTQDGIENVDDSTARLDDATELAESMGGEITDIYLTFGRYDLVVVFDFPDDETYARFALRASSQGTVRPESLKAFTENEYREIIGSLPG